MPPRGMIRRAPAIGAAWALPVIEVAIRDLTQGPGLSSAGSADVDLRDIRSSEGFANAQERCQNPRS